MSAAEKEEFLEALYDVHARVGCGDNLCMFVRPEGVATNDGCWCAERAFVVASLARLYRAAMAVTGDKP